jgi:hypothetical protein
MISKFLAMIGTEHQLTIAYRPESNGIVERANGEVGRHLRAIVRDHRVADNWSAALPLVQRIINAATHSAIGTSPARMLFGGMVDLNRELMTKRDAAGSEASTVEDYVSRLCELQRILIEASQKHQQAVVAERLERQPQAREDLDVGDYVVVSYPNRPPNKLTPRWRGPLVVVARNGSLCTCQDLLTLKSTDYHVSRLRRYDMSLTADPVDIAAKDADEWKVEAIVEHVGSNKRNLQFRVRWEGFGHEDDTWLPYADVRDLQALDAYGREHPELRL